MKLMLLKNRITFGLGNHVSEDLLIELDNILQKSRKELTTQVKKSKSNFMDRFRANPLVYKTILK